jgi:hypothetical protein
MYWHDLKKIILRHAPHPDQIQFPKQDGGYSPLDIQTILDLTLPKRRGLIHTGYSYDDYMRDSVVANGSWFNGEIPRLGWKGYNMTTERPARGWLQTLQILLEEGTIRPSAELDRLMGERSFDRAPVWQQLHYNEVAHD